MTSATAPLVEAARAILKSEGYFVDMLWHITDIHCICEQTGIPLLTHEQCMDVFLLCRQQFDGEEGFSWPKLEKAVQTYTESMAKQNCGN